GVAEARVEEAFGSVQVGGRLPTLLVAWSLPATVILAMLPVLMVASRRRRRSGDSAHSGQDPGEEVGSVLEHAALAVVLGCMIAAKVLSPQFVLWIAPLLALVARSPLDAVLVFMTAAMTTEIYPGLYDAL